MSDTITIIRTTRERPKEFQMPGAILPSKVPDDWLIFTAPRPLPCSDVQDPATKQWYWVTWEDWSENGFLHGVHRSAVNPFDKWYIVADKLKAIADLDGWFVEWGVTHEQVLSEYREYLFAEGYPAENIAELSEEQFSKSAYDHFLDADFNRRTMSVREFCDAYLPAPEVK